MVIHGVHSDGREPPAMGRFVRAKNDRQAEGLVVTLGGPNSLRRSAAGGAFCGNSATYDDIFRRARDWTSAAAAGGAVFGDFRRFPRALCGAPP